MAWFMVWLGLLAAVGTQAAEAPVASEPAAIPATAARAVAGLQVSALVDKSRAIPNDTVAYTVICRNHGPAAEHGILIEAQVPAGAALVHDGLPTGAVEPEPGVLRWTVPALTRDQEAAFTFRAALTEAAPGQRLQLTPTVKSVGMPHPRGGQAAATEVVGVPLLAVLAVPDVLIAGVPGRKPLIDIATAPGQRLVERLEGLGVVSGYPDGSFRPQAEVNRAEATKMVVAVRQLAGLRDRCGISILLGRPAQVAVQIEDGRGVIVRQLADGWSLPAGQQQLFWDGRDDAGQALPLGAYRYRVRAVEADGLRQELDGTVQIVTVTPLAEDLATTFVDVPATAWYHRYVARAEADGLVKGYPGGQFRPLDPIRRVENTVMVVRAAGLSHEAEAAVNTRLGFTDADDIPNWAVGYVAMATAIDADVGGKLLVGYKDNHFYPNQNLTREEAAEILERLLDREAALSVTTSGLVAAGHQVTIDGQPIATGENGRFRQSLALEADRETLVVQVR